MDADAKKCPFCAELIKAEAIKCKHCGSTLDSSIDPRRTSPRGTKKEAFVFMLVISIPFIVGGLVLAWFYSLPPGERERIEAHAR